MTSGYLIAQNPSDKGWFEADVIIGCAPYEINITNLGIRTGTLFVDWEGDPNDPYNTTEGFTAAFAANETLTNTYSTPGTYLIRTVDGSSDPIIENRFDFLTITVIDAIEPSFTAEACSNNQVNLTFDFGADNYDFYEIDFGDNTAPQTLDKSGSSVISYNYATQDTYIINVAGRLNGGNNISCANAPPVEISTIDIIPSPVITSVTALSQTSIQVDYLALEPNIFYRLELDAGDGFFRYSTIDPLVNPTSFTFDEPTFIDNFSQTVRILLVALNSCDASRYPSNEVSTIGLNFTLQPTTNTINIQYDWISTDIHFIGADFFQGGAFVFDTDQAQNSRLLTYNRCNEITEVYMQKVDENGTIVRSISAVPFQGQPIPLPQMATPSAELEGSDVNLTFTNPPFTYTEIRIYRRDLDGTYNQIGSTNTLNYTDTGVSGQLTEACYRSDYVDECGNVASVSNEACVTLEGLLRTPSAFSPNGDGVNDLFIVGSGVFDNFQMSVYNKWGTLVYEARDPSLGWDGNFNGQEAPVGTYVYKISYNRDGQNLVSTGTVTIIR